MKSVVVDPSDHWILTPGIVILKVILSPGHISTSGPKSNGGASGKREINMVSVAVAHELVTSIETGPEVVAVKTGIVDPSLQVHVFTFVKEGTIRKLSPTHNEVSGPSMTTGAASPAEIKTESTLVPHELDTVIE